METVSIKIEVDVDIEKFREVYADSTEPAHDLGTLAVALINEELARQLGGNAGMIRAGIGQLRLMEASSETDYGNIRIP